LKNLSPITEDNDVATKKYVDDHIVSGGGNPNLTLTALTLGNFRIIYNSTDDSLDIEVLS
jgi:hypothetical protein